MGNSVNKGVSTGGTKPPGSDPLCEELKKDVDAADEQVKDDIRKGSASPKSQTRKLNDHKASTVTASESTCKGKVKRTPAYSSLKRLPKREQGKYAQGTQGKPSNMCKKDNGRRFKHTPSNGRSSCNHTEGRLIEDLFAKHKNDEGRVPRTCKLVMKIKWKQRSIVKNRKGKVVKAFDRKPRDDPCPRCEKTICHAMKCGLNIYLCRTDEDGKERQRKPDCKKT